MNKMELEIEGMSCNHCVAAVAEALGELPGVSVDNVRIGEAQVSYHPDRVSPQGLNPPCRSMRSSARVSISRCRG